MDAAKRRPDHPEYDPTTLHIPPTWFKVILGGRDA
jgi:DNA mismatch repair protein MSH6